MALSIASSKNPLGPIEFPDTAGTAESTEMPPPVELPFGKNPPPIIPPAIKSNP